MKQTAVEWLHEEYMRILKDNDISVLQAFEILDKYNLAKEMFNEQIVDAAKSCNYIGGATNIEAQQYYNETYK
jgi:uncharacterized protein YajQ (UPF0234 family)